MKKLAKRQEKARYLDVICASASEKTTSCDCGLWEVSGIPCEHGLAVITNRRLNFHDFMDPYLTKALCLARSERDISELECYCWGNSHPSGLIFSACDLDCTFALKSECLVAHYIQVQPR
ncbi:hypothetical protein Ddye_006867 [Dipteronia dyeriana]|uniref:SWIM-type domain-containing protein n=1 Tax=Dipteronia dyeriana TaxID=168575 RepID=A0AAD9XJ07_9ROSI|nr:hypothetical protein Ddye_006867 [Dipteronia dyeriana]